MLVVWGLQSRRAASSQSSAMRPLRNLVRNPQQDFPADGITDVVTTELGRGQGLQVISGTSAATYKNSGKSLQTLRASSMSTIWWKAPFKPSIIASNINVRLVGARTDRHLWSKSYDIELNEARRTESEIAQAIASEISATLVSPRRPINPVSSEAYESHLKGRFMLAKGTEEATRPGRTRTSSRKHF